MFKLECFWIYVGSSFCNNMSTYVKAEQLLLQCLSIRTNSLAIFEPELALLVRLQVVSSKEGGRRELSDKIL